MALYSRVTSDKTRSDGAQYPAERSQINCNTVNVHDVTLCSLADQWEESRRMLIASTDAKSDMLCHISPFCICRFN